MDKRQCYYSGGKLLGGMPCWTRSKTQTLGFCGWRVGNVILVCP